jgi:hypothetical protein
MPKGVVRAGLRAASHVSFLLPRVQGGGGPMIAEHHLAMLAASGISEEFAIARGYETITDHRPLGVLRIVTAARKHVPGLLVPMLRVEGSTWGYQYRPDVPRCDSFGRPIKYETPYEQRNGLDVPPGVVAMLGDPSVPLWITEGCKKADCGAIHGLCIVALSGVWNWMHKNNAGGKTALEEFRDIALNGRRVIIAFDSDTARNDKVQKAMRALAGYLATKGARIEYLHLPDGDEKVGLDDFLVCHTVDELKTFVKPVQPRPTDGKQQHAAPPKPQPEPPPPFGSIDGAALLDEIDTYLSRYVVYPSGHMRHAHTLWAAHTHLMSCWESTPRIAFLSPEPSSGKTRALEVTEPLVPRPVHAVNTTSAYLFRKVSDPAGLPTVLYDEIDTVFGPKAKENEEIRGMLNAGHRNGAVAGRCVTRGDRIETEELPAYCAVAMAGLDDLPDTIMTRAVVVRMKPRARSEKVTPWRLRIDAPIGRELGQRLAQWAASVAEHATQSWPQIPAGVEDRDADVWEALLAVADLAGGHWPENARVAAVAAVADPKRKVPSLGLLLLRDIKTLFETHYQQTVNCHLMTHELVTDLKGVEESPWSSIKRDGSGIDARGLAQRLNPYGITSNNIRGVGGRIRKGYYRHAFTDAWKRYLPDDDDSSATSATADNNDDTSPGPTSDTSATSATSATSQVSDPGSVADEPNASATSAHASATTTPPTFRSHGDGDPSTNGHADRCCCECGTELADDESGYSCLECAEERRSSAETGR